LGIVSIGRLGPSGAEGSELDLTEPVGIGGPGSTIDFTGSGLEIITLGLGLVDSAVVVGLAIESPTLLGLPVPDDDDMCSSTLSPPVLVNSMGLAFDSEAELGTDSRAGGMGGSLGSPRKGCLSLLDLPDLNGMIVAASIHTILQHHNNMSGLILFSPLGFFLTIYYSAKYE